MIYLDHASHTPVDERVLAEFCRVEREFPANAFADHSAGHAARDEMNRATAKIAELVGAKPSEIIYTSGASEANNLAIKGLARAYKHVGKHILSTCLEHPSVSGVLAALQQNEGYEIELLKILPNGKIDLCALETAIRRDTVLICVSAVDSELGAVQPLVEIAEIVAAFPHCHLHIDAAQAMGKLPVHIHGLALSTFCFSPHKFHGLNGSGVLVKCEGVVLEPLIHGGGSQSGLPSGEPTPITIYRSGTPTVALAAACCTALDIAIGSMDENFCKVQTLRQYAIDELRKYSQVQINSPTDGSPYILNVSVTNVKARHFQHVLDEHGIAISTKSACSTDNAPSRPVFAVTQDKGRALSSWRASFSHLTTPQEIDALIAVVGSFHGN